MIKQKEVEFEQEKKMAKRFAEECNKKIKIEIPPSKKRKTLNEKGPMCSIPLL